MRGAPPAVQLGLPPHAGACGRAAEAAVVHLPAPRTLDRHATATCLCLCLLTCQSQTGNDMHASSCYMTLGPFPGGLASEPAMCHTCGWMYSGAPRASENHKRSERIGAGKPVEPGLRPAHLPQPCDTPREDGR